jgi:hypothetical protein
MSMSRTAGIVLPGYNPLKVANAPTIGTASQASGSSVSVAFTAPSCVGGGAISSYTAYANCGVKLTSGASSPLVVTGLTPGNSYTFKVIATNIYGPSFPSAASNTVTPNVIGQQAYTTAGTYSWVAPACVSFVSVVAVGGGGGSRAAFNAGCSTYRGMGGGAGGGLGYRNGYAVTPGNSYTVIVGAAGTGAGGTYPTSCKGGDSYFISTCVVSGGGGGSSGFFYCGGCAAGGPGAYTGTGGGSGGVGGDIFCGYRRAGGGGGAGGYSGNGGAGGRYSSPAAGVAGAGGSGGGGGSATTVDTGTGGGGGGVGILGQGANGTSGAAGANGSPGGGGSSGASGSGRSGGAYGAGAGGGQSTAVAGGVGAVRIIYPGTTRTFPSTCTGNL